MNNRIKVAVIPADLSEPTRFETVDRDDLDALQALVGGWIEELASPFVGTQLIVNEEGVLKRLRFNERVSRLAGVPVVGDAVLVGTDGSPDYVSLSPEWQLGRSRDLPSAEDRIDRLNASR